MKTLQFKTNINCGGCVAAVTPVLNNLKEIKKWEVNTNDPSKLLTVETELNPEDIQQILQKAGYKAEPVQ